MKLPRKFYGLSFCILIMSIFILNIFIKNYIYKKENYTEIFLKEPQIITTKQMDEVYKKYGENSFYIEGSFNDEKEVLYRGKSLKYNLSLKYKEIALSQNKADELFGSNDIKNLKYKEFEVVETVKDKLKKIYIPSYGLNEFKVHTITFLDNEKIQTILMELGVFDYTKIDYKIQKEKIDFIVLLFLAVLNYRLLKLLYIFMKESIYDKNLLKIIFGIIILVITLYYLKEFPYEEMNLKRVVNEDLADPVLMLKKSFESIKSSMYSGYDHTGIDANISKVLISISKVSLILAMILMIMYEKTSQRLFEIELLLVAITSCLGVFLKFEWINIFFISFIFYVTLKNILKESSNKKQIEEV